ncbi:MAG: helix-turn-helix domain-containing protein [Gammaproteobacteria bacterium]
MVVARSVIRFDLKQLRQACSRCSLAELAAEIPSLQRQLLRLMSKDIVGSQALTGDFTAQERMAAFVLSLSRRLQQRGYSPHEFLLAMTRRDIANFLRLATETVSRTLAEFQEQGLIAVERRDLRILDLRRLTALARNVPLI